MPKAPKPPELDEKDSELMAVITAVCYICMSQSFQYSSKPEECLEAAVLRAKDVILRIRALDWVT